MKSRALIPLLTVMLFSFASSVMAEKPTTGKSYQVVSDVPYQENETKCERDRCKLDLYPPTGRKAFPIA